MRVGAYRADLRTEVRLQRGELAVDPAADGDHDGDGSGHDQASDDGVLDIRLGNAYLNTGKYDVCVKSVRAGIRKGGLKSPDNAHISLGMCLYNVREYRAAIKAFETAGKTSRSRRVANQWTNVIRAEIERNKQIRLAEEAARKKRQELQERLARSGRV